MLLYQVWVHPVYNAIAKVGASRAREKRGAARPNMSGRHSGDTRLAAAAVLAMVLSLHTRGTD